MRHGVTDIGTEAGGSLLATVGRTLDMLVLVAERGPLGVTELADALGHPKAMAHRMASTLVSKGFLVQDPDSKKYAIGSQAFKVGLAFSVADFAQRVTHDALRSLASRYGYSSYVAILDNDRVLILKSHTGTSPIRIDSARSGDYRHIHATALGKALVAALPTRSAERLIQDIGFERLAPKTITDADEFRKDLELVREHGYAISNEESLAGVLSVGAALGLRDASVPIAISVSIPSFTATPDKMEELSTLVLSTVQQIRESVGHYETAGRK